MKSLFLSCFETPSLPKLCRRYPRGFTFYLGIPLKLVRVPALSPPALAALPSISELPFPRFLDSWFPDSLFLIEIHSLPAFARSYPRRFTFYFAHPIRLILPSYFSLSVRRTIFPSAPDSMTARCACAASASGNSLPIAGRNVPFSNPATSAA